MCSRPSSTTSGTGYGSNRPWAYCSVPYGTQLLWGTTMQCGSVVLHYIIQDTMDSVTSRNRASTYETMSRQALCSPLFCLTDKPNKWLDSRMESQHLRYGIAAHYRQEACAARLRRIRDGSWPPRCVSSLFRCVSPRALWGWPAVWVRGVRLPPWPSPLGTCTADILSDGPHATLTLLPPCSLSSETRHRFLPPLRQRTLERVLTGLCPTGLRGGRAVGLFRT